MTGDGFGQSLADDLRFLWRLRQLRRQALSWRRPTVEEERRADTHPVIGRFGDGTHAVRDGDGRWFVVRDRMWHGWPDPPEFALFVLDGDAIWCAADFDGWPGRWTWDDAPR